MHLHPGVDIIETTFGERPLNLVLFRGDKAALVDTGLVGIPTKSIIPSLRRLGLSPSELSLIVITHAHADHFGGNEELWEASGKSVCFAAHRLDQAWIENPPERTREAYRHFVELGLWSAEELDSGIQASGNGIKLHHVLEGGEVFDLGNGLQLEIIYAPGHSPGNICVLDRKNKVLAQGETVAGVGQYDVNGELLTVPFYEEVGIYLQTIAEVARLDFEVLVPSHLPPMYRRQARQFFEESLEFALRFEGEIRQRLERSTQAIQALELWRSMDSLWAQYPADVGLYMLLEAHLKGLLERGLVQESPDGGLTWAGLEDDYLQHLAQEARSAIEQMCV